MKPLVQQTYGLASAVDGPRSTKGQVRHYTGAVNASAHTHSVWVLHQDGEWKPTRSGSLASCKGTFTEIHEEILDPMLGVQIRDAKGKIVKQETVEAGYLVPKRQPTKPKKRRTR